ncbi:MAG TPA: TetR/AcrR family transcriptional regulator C-terminal ligand-binding domain-containing protein [Gemmatimonadales bacterium]|jgi:TetR/AcrR family transcriptional repressor of nem operon
MISPTLSPEKREEVVQAALDTFVERPWLEVTLEAIASSAGADAGQVEEAFGSREGLYRAALEVYTTQTVSRAEAELPQGSARAQLEMVCARAWDTLRTPQFTALYRVAIVLKLVDPSLSQHFRENIVDRWRRLLDTVLTRGAASGEFKPNAPAAGRVISSSLLLQAIWCNDAERLAPANKSRVVQELLDVVLEGIGGR